MKELITEILEEDQWWGSLGIIVDFLRAKAVNKVHVKFGFVLDRDLAGKRQPPDEIVELDNLESIIKSGVTEGTIEWRGMSDFHFHSIGRELAFTLCNDSDIHVASSDQPLLLELGHRLRSSGIKVYDSGQLI